MEEADIPVGVYWIRVLKDGIKKDNNQHFDYIGKSAASGKYATFQRGIFGRVYDHYRKLVHLPARGKIDTYIKLKYPTLTDKERIDHFSGQAFEDYDALRDYFSILEKGSLISTHTPDPWVECYSYAANRLRTYDEIVEFFSTKVLFRFNYITNRSDQEIAKAEGLALREYYYRYGKRYPRLNSRDEAKGLDGF